MEIEYALKSGQLVHISEVDRGLACECVCPACGGRMIARKGKVKAHHFSHQNSECEYGYETTVHLMAKAILEKEHKFLLPPVFVNASGHFNECLFEATVITFDKIRLEMSIDRIIPDITIYIDGKPLIIEIFVTHKTDDEKMQKIRQLKMAAIEVDLSDFDRTVSYDELKKTLLEEINCKKWLYNAKEEMLRLEYESLLKSLRKVTVYPYKKEKDGCFDEIHGTPGNCDGYPNGTELGACFDCDYHIYTEYVSKPDKYRTDKTYKYQINYCGKDIGLYRWDNWIDWIKKKKR